MTEPTLSSRYPHLMAVRRYVFIVTWGRSGSTLLQNILNKMPATCIRGENAHAVNGLALTAAALSQSESIRVVRQLGKPTEPNNPWYGAEGIDPAHIGRSLADLFVREVLRPPAGTRTAGFKEIRYHNAPGDQMAAFRFLHDHFPDARFIINTRSHEATMRSGWWRNMAPDAALAELKAAETLYARLERLYPKRTLRMHYDSYAGRPDALRPVFDFLGEPFDLTAVRATLAEHLDHSGT